MKVLLTGGAGLIGSHLVDALVKEHEMVVLDNLDPQMHTGGKPDYLNENATYIFDDIRVDDVLARGVKDTEVIFHQTAAVGVGQSMYRVEKYVDVNTMATAKLLDILVNEEHSVKKQIVASSMSIYGEGAYGMKDTIDYLDTRIAGNDAIGFLSSADEFKKLVFSKEIWRF